MTSAGATRSAVRIGPTAPNAGLALSGVLLVKIVEDERLVGPGDECSRDPSQKTAG